MIFLAKLKLDDSSKGVMESTQQVTKSVSGLTMPDFEKVASRHTKQSFPVSSQKDQAEETKCSPLRSGIPTSSEFLKTKAMNESSDFTVHQWGNFGQEILNADGDVVAWTVDAELAQRICRLLNE